MEGQDGIFWPEDLLKEDFPKGKDHDIWVKHIGSEWTSYGQSGNLFFSCEKPFI